MTRVMSNPSKPLTAEIEDPFVQHHAYRIDHVGISAYLMALAAWQRGLKVTFHYEVATKCERFANAAVQGFRGELFSVSDGERTHFFRRTLGDRTSWAMSALCNDKHATKQRLSEHGIRVPPGMVVPPGDKAQADAFMARYPGQRFVLKPLDGSLGIGVELNLSSAAVIKQLSDANKTLLLEVFIPSDYYRVYVVDGQVANGYISLPASVVGDGKSTIAALVEHKNRTRPHRPLYRGKELKLRDQERVYLKQQGFTFNSIPADGQRIVLNDRVFTADGADRRDMTAQLPAEVKTLAERAASALDIPFVGLDILVAHATGESYVLEANQQAIILGSAFPTLGPSPGNPVAEAIIDDYFPGSRDNPRHTKASFDFMKVCETLQSGVASEVTLPVLGPDWVHRRFQIAATSLGDNTLTTIRRAMFTLGIHAQMLHATTGALVVDVVAPEVRYHAFVRTLQQG